MLVEFTSLSVGPIIDVAFQTMNLLLIHIPMCPTGNSMDVPSDFRSDVPFSISNIEQLEYEY